MTVHFKISFVLAPSEYFFFDRAPRLLDSEPLERLQLACVRLISTRHFNALRAIIMLSAVERALCMRRCHWSSGRLGRRGRCGARSKLARTSKVDKINEICGRQAAWLSEIVGIVYQRHHGWKVCKVGEISKTRRFDSIQRWCDLWNGHERCGRVCFQTHSRCCSFGLNFCGFKGHLRRC